MTAVICQDCGVENCEARFHECLALDFSDPGYGAVHHLVVPTWMLQHHAYVDEARDWVITFVLDHLDRPPSDETRRSVRAHAEGGVRVARRGSVDGAAAVAGGPLSHLTVADVQTSSAEAYRRTVRAWAEAVATSAARNGGTT